MPTATQRVMKIRDGRERHKREREREPPLVGVAQVSFDRKYPGLFWIMT